GWAIPVSMLSSRPSEASAGTQLSFYTTRWVPAAALARLAGTTVSLLAPELASNHPNGVGRKLHVIRLVAQRCRRVGLHGQRVGREHDLPALAHIHLSGHSHWQPIGARAAAD